MPFRPPLAPVDCGRYVDLEFTDDGESVTGTATMDGGQTLLIRACPCGRVETFALAAYCGDCGLRFRSEPTAAELPPPMEPEYRSEFSVGEPGDVAWPLALPIVVFGIAAAAALIWILFWGER